MLTPPCAPPARALLLAVGAAFVLLPASVPARAQGAAADSAEPRPDGSRASACGPGEDAGGERQYRGFACERRILALGPRAALSVDAGPSGGISVRGTSGRVDAPGRGPARDSVTVVATVTAYARTDSKAARLAATVALADSGGMLRAQGPARRYDARGRDPWWSVAWRAEVPRHTDLTLRATNGGVRVAGVAGRLRLETVNGRIELDSVAGQVRGRATNGGVAAVLTGAAWDAAGLAEAGLDLTSTNGGAMLRLPAVYSARVSVGSINGPLAVRYPVGAARRGGNELDVTLGGGGAPVRVFSYNGGVWLSVVR